MNIAVVGADCAGLVVGSCLAESGNEVVCVENNEDRVRQLSKGEIPIYEPGLAELVQRNLRHGRLSFTSDLPLAVKKSFVLFITVETSQMESGADLMPVGQVARDIGRSMKGFRVVVVKSTLPVGTTEQIRDLIRAETDQPFDLILDPEFTKSGAAVEDFMRPDRVVLGTEDERAAEVLRELYAPFVRTGSPIVVTDIRTAEMAKHASDAYLAARVSFMNEIANLCEYTGADIEIVRRCLGLDKRIGPSFLFAGVGFGGSSFPKNLDALIVAGHRHSYPMQILEAVARVNAAQRIRFLKRVLVHFGGEIRGKRIAVWGLAFKPRTSDVRGAPAIDMILGLLEAGATVVAYDPEAIAQARQVLGSQVEFTDDNYGCLAEADALLLLTEWQLFRNPDFDRMKSEMREPVVFDGRNVYDARFMREAGFTYYSIGRQ